jgi:hypothetical protein
MAVCRGEFTMKNLILCLMVITATTFTYARDLNVTIGANPTTYVTPALLRQPSLMRLRSDYPISDYQIGSEWGKKPVTEEILKSESEVFKKAAARTAAFGGGTAFYLGKFNGYHIMATNYHVLSSMWQCENRGAYFDVYEKPFKCLKYFGSWSDVDFALFAIEVKPEDEAFLASVAQNMAFHSRLYKGEKLLTIGHGIAGNPGLALMAGQDSDCVVYSEPNDVRFMADPDDVNPGDYSVWSFANGCDVSHGDSGSAMVDRETGDIVGIIWTGRIPKNPKVQDENYLKQIYQANSEDVWKELSYAAPSSKIYEVLTDYLNTSNVPVDRAETLREILK